ncbi:MAG: site-specific DNA-methyltransferase [Planctomycetota bacterium]|nr:site-specific DNA-methyltransferase [Planctomycetota bacterium]
MIHKPVKIGNWCTLYRGNALEILPTLPRVGSAIVTDPPYGISWCQGSDFRPGHMKTFARDKSRISGDDQRFDPLPLLAFPEVICWGANYYADKLPHGKGWLIWFKSQIHHRPTNFSDAEIAWCSSIKTVKVFKHLWQGFRRDSERGIRRVHPTQKAIAVMEWCLGFVEGRLIIDPYMGSGTTAVALAGMRIAGGGIPRRFIGIEKDRRHFDVAVDRIRAAVAKGNDARRAA